jgi:hypothetical protein
VSNIKNDTFISQFKARSLPVIESKTSPTTIPTTTNEATTSKNIPTTLTNEFFLLTIEINLTRIFF